MGSLFEQARILVVRGELPAAHQALDAVLVAEPTHRGALLLKAREKARTTAVERDTLEQSIGAAVEEVLERLADARAALETVQSELKRTRDARETARVSEALARQGVDTETQHLQADAAQRDVAIAALKTFGAARLLDVAQTGFDVGDPPGWSVTRAVEVARGIETALANFDSDDGSWQRVQRDIHASIQRLTDTLLPYDYQPGTTLEDGLFVVTVPFRGRTCTMTDLRSVLAEAERARALLDEGDNDLQAGPVYLTLVWCLREMRLFREALAMAEEGLRRVPDAILANWAATVEDELAEAQKEEC